MKKLYIIILSCILAPVAIHAQTETNEADFFKAAFGLNKLDIYQNLINLAPENLDSFWGLFQQYEEERLALRAEKIILIQAYSDNYMILDNKDIDKMVKTSFSLNDKTSKLLRKYYKKLRKAGGSKAAGQFMQIETYFRSIAKATLYENLPLIGELDTLE